MKSYGKVWFNMNIYIYIYIYMDIYIYTSCRLRLEMGGGQQIFLSCACFLITQAFLNIYRHTIHQIKADYHSYLLV